MTISLQVGLDPATGYSVLGGVVDGKFSPSFFKSPCGKFDVEPQATYGIPMELAEHFDQLNQGIRNATDAALIAGGNAFVGSFALPNKRSGDEYFDNPAVRKAVSESFAYSIGATLIEMTKDGLQT